MPRMTKADQERIWRKKQQDKMVKEDPPWSESNRHTDYYHTHEIEALKQIRLDMENLALALERQRARYTLSAVIIPQSLPEQLKALTDAIYDEEQTRDMSGRLTKDSLIALNTTLQSSSS